MGTLVFLGILGIGIATPVAITFVLSNCSFVVGDTLFTLVGVSCPFF
jgi:hypothetical protein